MGKGIQEEAIVVPIMKEQSIRGGIIQGIGHRNFDMSILRFGLSF
jgi:hypothetical protein